MRLNGESIGQAVRPSSAGSETQLTAKQCRRRRYYRDVLAPAAADEAATKAEPTGVVAGIVVPQYMVEFLERSRVKLALRLAAQATGGRAS